MEKPKYKIIMFDTPDIIVTSSGFKEDTNSSLSPVIWLDRNSINLYNNYYETKEDNLNIVLNTDKEYNYYSFDGSYLTLLGGYFDRKATDETPEKYNLITEENIDEIYIQISEWLLNHKAGQ